VGGAGGLAALAASGLLWPLPSAAESPLTAPPRRALIVKPIFTYPLTERRPQTSWRSWGGIETRQDVDAEIARIQGELEGLQAAADFPLKILPLASIRRPGELGAHRQEIDAADALLVYAAGDGGGDLMASVNPLDALGKDTVFFVRYRSGPLYYWYEGAMARFLHQHTDRLASRSVDYEDVVVDRMDEVLWRLRALSGLRSTVGSRIVAVGGAAAWAQPPATILDLVGRRWKLDIRTVSYEELGRLIQAARADAAAVALARGRTEDYLRLPGTALETERKFVENAFLLEQVLRGLMHQAGCRALTINDCMSTIMPLSETTACLALSLLNDAGYLAFCESDFVAIPAGILLANISGRPVFFNDPTYPHDGLITLAHCTAPRRMDGKGLEPARILTHFESDYGAAPKVEMKIGQKVTNLCPDFKAERWTGLVAEIVDHPFLPICRSQIDIHFGCGDLRLAESMPGFHWVTCYGEYLRETGYALKKIPISLDSLG